MTTQAQYAKALFDLVAQSPAQAAEHLKGLKASLERRGHQKLLPQIFKEFLALVERQERSLRYATVTKEAQRTRKLLELYRTLVATT
jgi:hypothetical protein